MQRIESLGLLGVRQAVPPQPLSLAQAQRIAGITPAKVSTPAPKGWLARIAEFDAVVITEKQARGWLPDGRYVIKHADGTTTTLERGQHWCAEGTASARNRRRDAHARSRFERDRAVADLFGDRA